MFLSIKIFSWVLLVCCLYNVIHGASNVSVENPEMYSSIYEDINFVYSINYEQVSPKAIEIDTRPVSNTNLISFLLSVDMGNDLPLVTTYTKKDSDVIHYNGRINVDLQHNLNRLIVIFTLKNISETDYDKEYRCTAVYSSFEQPYANIVLLKAVPPKVYETTFFTSATIYLSIGLSYEFICRANGKPIPSVLWLLNETVISTGSGSAVLKFNNIQSDQNGNYVCRALNIGGVEHKNVSFLVIYINSGIFQSQIFNLSSTLNVDCNIDGVPTPIYKWFNPQGEFITSNKRLQIENLRNFGNFTCIANNIVGEKVFVFNANQSKHYQNAITLTLINGAFKLNQSSMVFACLLYMAFKLM